MVEGREAEFDGVNDDYQMITPGDFVLGPSVDDAGPVRILESRMSGNGFSDDENEGGKIEMDEARQSLRVSIEDASRMAFENSCVKDFSGSEAIIEPGERDPVSGGMKNVLMKVPCDVDNDTDEVVLGWDSAEVARQTEDFRPVGEQAETRFGTSSEQEMRMSGAKTQFGKKQEVKLSAEEARYISPKLAAILREEKFGKK